jgi:hypothetical protein
VARGGSWAPHWGSWRPASRIGLPLAGRMYTFGLRLLREVQ